VNGEDAKLIPDIILYTNIKISMHNVYEFTTTQIQRR